MKRNTPNVFTLVFLSGKREPIHYVSRDSCGVVRTLVPAAYDSLPEQSLHMNVLHHAYDLVT